MKAKVYIVRNKVSIDSVYQAKLRANNKADELNKKLRNRAGGYIYFYEKYEVEEWEVF